MSLAKKGRLGDHSFLHGFDTLEHGFNTEVLTPENLHQPASTGESSTFQPANKKRILILTNEGKNQSTKTKRSFKTVTTKEHYQFGDYTFAINSRKSGCYTQILNTLVTQTLAMQSIYKRILFMRFDIQQGVITQDNKRITTILKRLRKRLIHRYGNTKFGYLWVREECKKKGLHYHFVFMMDGDIVRYPSNIHDQVRGIWFDMGGTNFHFANHHYINNEEKLREAIKHGSYLAKTRSKGNRPDQTKDYGASRLRINKRQGLGNNDEQ
tara:strand:- start:463 stop:1266 length:804 start_codon:yes stop_codon:yes gene_type:complete